MHSTHLHEHDANQGAQSSGEFLGMTGNCGWYLLGSGGVTILMVIFLWGILGVSLLLCLLTGVVLCGLSVAYVFALKNNKPEHYDSDYFESALIEAGVMQLRFGPRDHRPMNPFVAGGAEMPAVQAEVRDCERLTRSVAHGTGGAGAVGNSGEPARQPAVTKAKPAREKEDLMVPRVAYERLSDRLATTEDLLEHVLAEHGEDVPCV